MTLEITKLGFALAGDLAWPSALVFVAWRFKSQIGDLLKRSKSIEALGVKSEFNPAELSKAQQSQPIEKLSDQSVSTFTLPPADDVVLTPLDQHHRNALETEVQDASLRESWAIRMWSSAELQRRHEATYRLIFGSQIAALKALQLWGEGPAERFKVFYDGAAANVDWKDFYESYAWESWADFMLRTGYVGEVPDHPAWVRITPLGQNFLHWMIGNRVSEAKGL